MINGQRHADEMGSFDERVAILVDDAQTSLRCPGMGSQMLPDGRSHDTHRILGLELKQFLLLDQFMDFGGTAPNIPLAGLSNDLLLASQYQPIEDELRVALQIAEDTGTQAGSEAWEAFLAYYGVLSSMAQRMPDLAAELQPVVDFMATGPRKKAT